MLETLSILGAKYLFLVIVGIAVIYILKQPRVERKRIVVFAAVSLPLTYIVSKIGGLLYVDPRPFVVGHFVPLIPHEPDNGFPSNHELLCASVAALIYPSNKSLSITLWGLTLLVGVARVRTGIHHPVDIIGSSMMATVVAGLVYRVVKARGIGSRN